ncbi:MAG: DUF1015 domain-containing protein [Thermodesulfovibrionales bacterium]|nr:DUF1015 domain-containing protein [Thermodesulfovibrionales bacterium]
MAEIIPFRGILYNVSKVSGEDTVAPPYDIITPEYKEQLYNKSPYNIVRIDFGKELAGDNGSENKYKRASEFFNLWIKEGVLARSNTPGFYAHEIEYEIKGKLKKLRGFFSLVRLEELGKGNIHPHECTHSKPKADRLDLMRACNANISPIFSLYNSPEKKASEVIKRVTGREKPCIEAKDPDGAIHRLWPIENKNDTESIQNDLKDRAIFIADGHHRYETALEFQKEMNKSQESGVRSQEKNSELQNLNSKLNPWDYVLMFLANISDEGLTILPAHRLVKGIPENPVKILSEYFNVEEFSLSEKVEDSISGYEHAIGFYQHNNRKQYILKHKGAGLDDLHPALRGLDVTVLHELIFKKLLKITDIGYEMDIKETMDRVKNGLYDAAFFLNPTKVEDVERVALSDVRMPPKSTYFYPKLLTGLVINKF